MYTVHGSIVFGHFPHRSLSFVGPPDSNLQTETPGGAPPGPKASSQVASFRSPWSVIGWSRSPNHLTYLGVPARPCFGESPAWPTTSCKNNMKWSGGIPGILSLSVFLLFLSDSTLPTCCSWFFGSSPTVHVWVANDMVHTLACFVPETLPPVSRKLICKMQTCTYKIL